MGQVVALNGARQARQDVGALEAMEAWLAEYRGIGGRSKRATQSQHEHVGNTLVRIASALGLPPEALELADCGRDQVVAALLDYRYGPDPRFTTHPELAPTERSAESVRRRISALRTFFGWCLRTDRIAVDPTITLEAPPRKKPAPKALGEKEARAVLTAAAGATWALRDFAIVSVALGCGLRLSELTGLTLDRVEGRPPKTLCVLGKGTKERRVPLTPLATEALRAWLPERRRHLKAWAIPDETALFLTARPRRKVVGGKVAWEAGLTRDGMAEVIERCLERAGVRRPGLRVHVLRHSCATLALSSRAYTIREVQELLGHSTLSTTAVYTTVTSEDLEVAARRHPLGKSHSLK